MIVVVACGKAKRDYRTAACDMYTGSLHRMGLRWAESVAPASNIYILSALYGIVGHDEFIDPYDLRLGQPGSITADQLDVPDERPLFMVGGADYVRLIREVEPDVRVPFGKEAGHRGQGYMMQAMKRSMGHVPEVVT